MVNERQVTPAPPLADWFVIGRAVVVRTYGVQDRNGVRFWSAILSPLFPNFQEIDYRMQFYASIFKEDYFELGETIQEGDELIVQGILQPRTETSSDGRIRGTMTLRLTHFELAPLTTMMNDDDDYGVFTGLDDDDDDETIVADGTDDESEDPFA